MEKLSKTQSRQFKSPDTGRKEIRKPGKFKSPENRSLEPGPSGGHKNSQNRGYMQNRIYTPKLFLI